MNHAILHRRTGAVAPSPPRRRVTGIDAARVRRRNSARAAVAVFTYAYAMDHRSRGTEVPRVSVDVPLYRAGEATRTHLRQHAR